MSFFFNPHVLKSIFTCSLLINIACGPTAVSFVFTCCVVPMDGIHYRKSSYFILKEKKCHPFFLFGQFKTTCYHQHVWFLTLSKLLRKL